MISSKILHLTQHLIDFGRVLSHLLLDFKRNDHVIERKKQTNGSEKLQPNN